jgi:hypothetical protein
MSGTAVTVQSVVIPAYHDISGRTPADQRTPRPLRSKEPACSAVLARLDESGFVGGDDRLHPVAAAQLHQDVAIGGTIVAIQDARGYATVAPGNTPTVTIHLTS